MRGVGEASIHRRRPHELPLGDPTRRSAQRRPPLELAERHAGRDLERAQRLRAPEPQPFRQLVLAHPVHRVVGDGLDRSCNRCRALLSCARQLRAQLLLHARARGQGIDRERRDFARHPGRERCAERKFEAIEVQHLRASVDLHPVLDTGANDHDVAFDPFRLRAHRERPVEAGEDARHGVAVRRQVAGNEREQRARERRLAVRHRPESTKVHVCSTRRRRQAATKQSSISEGFDER